MPIGQDLLNVPMGDMIRQMAFAIADAQMELDESSVRIAELMSGSMPPRDANGDIDTSPDPSTDQPRERITTTVRFGGEDLSMMELGFSPTFYQFVDTIIEVKIAIRMTTERETQTKMSGKRTAITVGKGGFRVVTTPVDATYSSKYSYSAEGSSLLRTKLVPVPAPSILEDRIRSLLETRVAGQEQG